MRTIRIFTSQSLTVGESALLEEAPSHHLLKVLRLKPGAPVTLFNGQGGEYGGAIEAVNGKQAHVAIERFDSTDRESPLFIHLGIGISRGDRFDWVVQKATELGVGAITPLLTDRTEVKLKAERADKKLRHWQQIVISACEQSGRNRVPALSPPAKLAEWLSIDGADLKLVAHHRTESSLKELAISRPKTINLLVGPEGGLSETEIDRAVEMGFNAISLGPRVLRTETAPIALLTALQSLWGDMA